MGVLLSRRERAILPVSAGTSLTAATPRRIPATSLVMTAGESVPDCVIARQFDSSGRERLKSAWIPGSPVRLLSCLFATPARCRASRSRNRCRMVAETSVGQAEIRIKVLVGLLLTMDRKRGANVLVLTVGAGRHLSVLGWRQRRTIPFATCGAATRQRERSEGNR